MIETRPCSVPDCEGNAHYSAKGRRGWCSSHYMRWRRHGDPLAGRTARGEPLRWLENVALAYEGDECLIWPYGRNADGYGLLKIGGKWRVASRVICERAHNVPPTPEHHAAHSCGKGHEGCVTKKHLRWASPKENQADRVEHGTSNRGDRHWNSKLTEADVLAIRELMARGQTQADVAKEFGISRTTISNIVHRKMWSWLEKKSRAI